MALVAPSGLALALAVLVVISARWPLHALRGLLILLPIHSAGVLLFANVVRVDGLLLTLGSAWKEAIIAGLTIAAVVAFVRRPRRLGPVQALALVLLAIIVARMGTDLLTTSGSRLAVLYGGRQLAEFLVVLLAVGILAPPIAWFRRTAFEVLPVLVFCAVVALLQPSLGAGFYDAFFHAPGERLHHSYLVNVGDVRRLRAVGTFIAPNELGLGIIVLGSIFAAPLLLLVRRWRVLMTAGMLLVVALLLTFSRSAWLGAAVGTVATGLYVRREVLRQWRAQILLRLPLREVLVGLGMAAIGTALIFVLIGGLTLLVGTVSGTESSAAGRGESIGAGIGWTLDHPGGLGLGTAGPRAYELTGSAVLTENWYLVYGIQLGIVPMVILAAFAILVVVAVARTTKRLLRGVVAPLTPAMQERRYAAFVAVGTLTALVAALLGGLVIPALLDLPASLALWSAVAIVLAWGSTADSTPRSDASNGP